MSRRSIPFSGKAKKAQLKSKRERLRRQHNDEHSELESSDVGKSTSIPKPGPKKAQVDEEYVLPSTATKGVALVSRRDLRTVFRKESPDEVARRREDSTRPFVYSSDHVQEKTSSGSPLLRVSRALTTFDQHPDVFLRPSLHISMVMKATVSSAELDKIEISAFEKWKDSIYSTYSTDDLNQFEHNLEVWRQLWRVIERSDIVIFLADARCPAIHFHESLYKYVTVDHNKECILCLTKADLVSVQQASSWKAFFKNRYPDLKVVHFSSSSKFIHVKGTRAVKVDPLGINSAMRILKSLSDCTVTKDGLAVSARPYIEEAIKSLDDRNLSDILTVATDESAEEEHTDGGDTRISDIIEKETLHEENENFSDSKYIVVGIIGDPNMGKSSLLNTLLGKKRVSVSSTPGHTKHLQTIYMTKNLVLCDCPGVVLPQIGIPRSMQVVFGQYPIAQVREPYSHVRFIGENCWPPLHVVFKLLHTARQYREDLEYVTGKKLNVEDMDDFEWSPYTICYCLAIREGFMVKGKGGRPDTFRAANKILRDSLSGAGGIFMSFWPPENNFQTHVDDFEMYKDVPFLQDSESLSHSESSAPSEQQDELSFETEAESAMSSENSGRMHIEQGCTFGVLDSSSSTSE